MSGKYFGIYKQGIVFGLFLQLAIGPVFLYIINIALDKTIYAVFASVLAVTLADFSLIAFSVLGIGALSGKIKKKIAMIGSLILVFFGSKILLESLFGSESKMSGNVHSSIISGFFSVLALTITNPQTIIFFTGVFAAKAAEYDYVKRDLYVFGLGVGSATPVFIGTCALIMSILKEDMPSLLIQTMNVIAGLFILGHGAVRLKKSFNA